MDQSRMQTQEDILEKYVDNTTANLIERNDQLSKENVVINERNSTLARIIISYQKKLKFYSENSPKHPQEDVELDIIKSEAYFDVMEKRWKTEKENLIRKHEEKIKDLVDMVKVLKSNEVIEQMVEELKKLRERLSQYEKGGAAPVQSSSSKEEELRSKVSQMETKEKESKSKLIEAAKRMKNMKEEMTTQKKKIEDLEKQLTANSASSASGSGVNAERLQAYESKIKAQKDKFAQLLKATMKTHKDDLKDIKQSIAGANKGITGVIGPMLRVISEKIIERSKSSTEELRTKYLKEMNERKRLFNLVQELKGNIRVFCRVRPLNSSEKESCVSISAEGVVAVDNKDTHSVTTFEFDNVFGISSTQIQVFEEVRPLITSILDGYNVCIFAYGQTGSGKTFTMQGPPENPGVNTRALDELFKVISERKEAYIYRLEVSLLEIYNETIRDLFAEDQKQKLEIKQGQQGNYVPGLIAFEAASSQEVQVLLEKGSKNRAVGSTNMNEHSSRSHLIFTINIYGKNKLDNKEFTGKLHLIDLAGSERLSKTKVEGQAAKESIAINKSLSALGDVIAARAANNPHIPFRNSTLTYLLQDSLSGDSKTLMVLQLSPAATSQEETVCSCKFATKARTVEFGPTKKAAPGKK